jgi:hypothetical protein
MIDRSAASQHPYYGWLLDYSKEKIIPRIRSVGTGRTAAVIWIVVGTGYEKKLLMFKSYPVPLGFG